MTCAGTLLTCTKSRHQAMHRTHSGQAMQLLRPPCPCHPAVCQTPAPHLVHLQGRCMEDVWQAHGRCRAGQACSQLLESAGLHQVCKMPSYLHDCSLCCCIKCTQVAAEPAQAAAPRGGWASVAVQTTCLEIEHCQHGLIRGLAQLEQGSSPDGDHPCAGKHHPAPPWPPHI
jgi:hypothetical protein